MHTPEVPPKRQRALDNGWQQEDDGLWWREVDGKRELQYETPEDEDDTASPDEQESDSCQ